MTAAVSLEALERESDGDSSIDSMPEHDKEPFGNGSIDADLDIMEVPVKPSSSSSCMSTEVASASENEHRRKRRTDRKSKSTGKVRKERRRRSSTKQRDEDSTSKARASRSRSMSNFDRMVRSRSTNRSGDGLGDSSPTKRSKSLTKVKNKRSSRIRKSRHRHSASKPDDETTHNDSREQRRIRRERRKKRRSHSSKDGNVIEDTEVLSCSNHSARSSNRYDGEDSDATGQSGRSCKSYQSAPSSIPTYFDMKNPFGGAEDDDDLSVELVPCHHGISNNDHLRKLLANNIEALERSRGSVVAEAVDEEAKPEKPVDIESSREEEDAAEPPALVALDFSRDAHLRKVLADGLEAMEQSMTSFTFEPEEEQPPLAADDTVVQCDEDEDSVELVALDFSRDASLRKKLAEGIEAMEKSLTSINFNGAAQAFDSEEERAEGMLENSRDVNLDVNEVSGSASAVETHDDAHLQETTTNSNDTSDPDVVKSCVVEGDKPTDSSPIGSRPKRGSFRFTKDRMNLSFQNLKEVLGRKRLSKTTPVPDLSGSDSLLSNYHEVGSDDERDPDIATSVDYPIENPSTKADSSLPNQPDSPQPVLPSSNRRLNLAFMSRRRRGSSSASLGNLNDNATVAAVQDEKTETSCTEEGRNDPASMGQGVNEDMSPRSVTTIGLRLAKRGNTLQKRLQALSNRSGRETPTTQSCSDLRSVDDRDAVTFACDMNNPGKSKGVMGPESSSDVGFESDAVIIDDSASPSYTPSHDSSHDHPKALSNDDADVIEDVKRAGSDRMLDPDLEDIADFHASRQSQSSLGQRSASNNDNEDDLQDEMGMQFHFQTMKQYCS